MIRECPACGRNNHVPARHLADTGRCGACKAALPPVAAPLPVDETLFDEIVGDARVPVLVDFWAGWCQPCRMAAPEVDAVAREMAGRALVLKVDTDAYPRLAARYRIRGIPNFVVLKDGRVVSQQAGVVGRDVMESWVEQAGA